jgi:cytochrome c-type biogenesis protein CcmH
MLVWMTMALMTGAAALAVLWPLARPQRAGDSAPDGPDAAFYRAQLTEIERDAARGLIAPDEAEIARTEAGRRVLAAIRREGNARADSTSQLRIRVAAAAALVLLPAVSLGIYLSVGRPDLPAQPLAARDVARGGGVSMDEALAKIEKHLAANPEDGRAQELVAPAYMSAGRYADAAKAYAAALRLLGPSGDRLENLAEAYVATADGVVTAEARELFERSLMVEPGRPKARFYRGLAAEQDGDRQAAIALYSGLIDDAPPGSPIAANLAQRITKLGGTPPKPQPEATAGPASPAGAAVAALPERERMAAIRGMVETLDARLAADGRDVDGWLRLVRSYVVLGEADKARSALARGRTALAGDTAGRNRLEALAREFALGGS